MAFQRAMMSGRFGRLTVDESVPPRVGRWKSEDYPGGKVRLQWFCRCDCGGTKWVSGSYLRRGETKSCGCLRPKRAPDAGIAFDPVALAIARKLLAEEIRAAKAEASWARPYKGGW